MQDSTSKRTRSSKHSKPLGVAFEKSNAFLKLYSQFYNTEKFSHLVFRGNKKNAGLAANM